MEREVYSCVINDKIRKNIDDIVVNHYLTKIHDVIDIHVEGFRQQLVSDKMKEEGDYFLVNFQGALNKRLREMLKRYCFQKYQGYGPTVLAIYRQGAEDMPENALKILVNLEDELLNKIENFDDYDFKVKEDAKECELSKSVTELVDQLLSIIVKDIAILTKIVTDKLKVNEDGNAIYAPIINLVLAVWTIYREFLEKMIAEWL